MAERLQEATEALLAYGIRKGVLAAEDADYARNRIYERYRYKGESFLEQPAEEAAERSLEEILKELNDLAAEKGLLEHDSVAFRDLWDTGCMGAITPLPSQVATRFYELYRTKGAKAATDWYYGFSQATDYIRSYRIVRDEHWVSFTPYGEMDITINLSKPEKDPKAIAAAKLQPQGGYPACLLCKECVGYAGHTGFPARQNHRIIPVKLQGEEWGFQYSPYVYYNEHCIVFSYKHSPMTINPSTFEKLFDFVELFPHYILGSNADLPIVGGSILTHEHFQGGAYEFPMAKAAMDEAFSVPGISDVEMGIVHWPMAVIRLRGKKRQSITALATRLLKFWREYSDISQEILAFSEGEPHNTITPIARKKEGVWELDLVLRNNRTTPEHPLGIFHPHAPLHHIKKENIGLIEVMGVAILPARLKTELADLKEVLLGISTFESHPELEIHRPWAEELLKNHPDFSKETGEEILRQEVGRVFEKVLADAGVFKDTFAGREGFRKCVKAFLLTIQ